ncbi:aminodeoxychorismate lyase [Gilvimarinus chinensis]|uniref:aminodeoxychorismate lyase n=1 Tax=Gilvimarinus chinensis TaxID=396005 RepID=UPI000377BB63|nr:aminodeoxychorismate lyase [Gilvimarinus chinensis]
MADSTKPQVWIDGRQAAGLSPLDRGLAYGDGLFETIALYGGHAPLLSLHLNRLKQSAAALSIDIADETLINGLEPVLALLDAKACGLIKIILTRGDGGRGYDPSGADQSRLICFYFPDFMPLSDDQCVNAVRLCRQTLGRNPTLAGHKHLSRLEQVLARAEWRDPAVAEGLLCDSEGEVIEATASNIFVFNNGAWVTPVLDNCGVRGVMRQLLSDDIIPALGLSVIERRLRLEDLKTSDELIICNSVRGVRSVGVILDEGGKPWHEYSGFARAVELQKSVRTHFERAIN